MNISKNTRKKKITKIFKRFFWAFKRRVHNFRELCSEIHFTANDSGKGWSEALYIHIIEPRLSNFLFQPGTELARLASYVPVLWRNYDWEGMTLIPLVEHKLRRMRRCFAESSTRAVNAEIIAEIDIALNYFRAAREDAWTIAKKEKRCHNEVKSELLAKGFDQIGKKIGHWWD